MNIAYIDSQNIKLGVRDNNREMDREKFFVYMKRRYALDEVKYFVGYIQENEKFYSFLRGVGYTLVFKKSVKQKDELGKIRTKGNVDTLIMKIGINDADSGKLTKAFLFSGDGDFEVLIEYRKKIGVFGKVFLPSTKKTSQLLLECTDNMTINYLFDVKKIIQQTNLLNDNGVPTHGSEVTDPGGSKINIYKNPEKSRDFADKNARIYVAGHRGLVGSAIVRQLEAQGYSNLIYRTHAELDLTDAKAVALFFEKEKPEYVFLAAAKVGGIMANNTYPADFLYQNLQIQNHVIHNAYIHGVNKLLFLGSSCIYPKQAEIPIKESSLLTGLLEPTNEPYAIAKITGIKMCQSYNRQYGTNFIACMPTNLYGPYDNFDLTSSHVMPAMIRKFHEAKINNSPTVVCRGDGSPMREFLYVDDMADGCIYLMNYFTPTPEQNESGEIFVNIGTGSDITIKELAETVQKIVGYTGEIIWDTTKPNGTMRKVMDVSRLEQQGWKAMVGVEKGVKNAYQWFLEHNKGGSSF